ncbi:hypothetical protein V8Q34_14850 [Blautia sp. JLR.GB0024]|uniref:hypothetical protein n=1 Tax=Blautia sp. JLR.GB0024 TaxID=3123295 RepID=UPI0030064528
MIESGLKELVQYGNELAVPNLVERVGVTYSDKKLYAVDEVRRANALEMSTLTSLVEYIKSKTDVSTDKMIVQVVSPEEVRLISALDDDRKREVLAEVNAQIPGFDYGRYIGHESFIIALQSKFIQNDDCELLLKFAGTVENGTVAQYGDDGVTQKATIKTGIASKGEAVVPNPVKLRPFRTFIEVEQPESAFVFRMRQDERNGIECAIFEADGGAWKNTAMKSIKEYLQYELSEYPNFTVIS